MSKAHYARSLISFFLLNYFFNISFIYADKTPDVPWFTGPLLTPSAKVTPLGKLNIQPYLYAIINNGEYDINWEGSDTTKIYQLEPQIQFKYGLTKVLDIAATVQGFYSSSEGASDFQLGDLPLSFDFQLLTEEKNFCDIKLSFQETFPTGNYQYLDPQKKECDIGGLGSFSSLIGITFGKLFPFFSHFLNLKQNFSSTFYSPVNVKGLNSYGGDTSTKGTVYPGTTLTSLTGVEYNVTKKIALALDIQGVFEYKTGFKGHTVKSMTSPNSVQWSIAPAIEYNFDETSGIILGSWFTIFGKSAKKFKSVVGSYTFYF